MSLLNSLQGVMMRATLTGRQKSTTRNMSVYPKCRLLLQRATARVLRIRKRRETGQLTNNYSNIGTIAPTMSHRRFTRAITLDFHAIRHSVVVSSQTFSAKSRAVAHASVKGDIRAALVTPISIPAGKLLHGFATKTSAATASV